MLHRIFIFIFAGHTTFISPQRNTSVCFGAVMWKSASCGVAGVHGDVCGDVCEGIGDYQTCVDGDCAFDGDILVTAA